MSITLPGFRAPASRPERPSLLSPAVLRTEVLAGKGIATIGLDAVVGSVGNGATLRLFSDIKNVKYTEGRFLPYFFPDVFHEGGDPIMEAKTNWVTARRAILRSPIQRIGYGGYLKLALQFPDFVDYIESVCDEFRTLYDNIQGVTPYCVKKVAVLNCWGNPGGQISKEQAAAARAAKPANASAGH